MSQVEVERMSRKKIRLLVVATLAWVLVCPASRPACTAAVLANPQPTIAVQAKTPVVTVGPIRAGDFSATVAFSVGATSERVHLYLEASDLWHSGDPTDPRKAGPIALNTSRPARIIAQIGRRDHGPHDGASWRGAGDPISGFQSKKTETVIYESGQRGQFNQDITCKVWYTQPTPDKTAGQYSGKVRLTALVLPEGHADPPRRGHIEPPGDPTSIPPRKYGPPPATPGLDDAQRKYRPPSPAPGSDDAQRSVKREGHTDPPARGHLEGPSDSAPGSARKNGAPPGAPGSDDAQRSVKPEGRTNFPARGHLGPPPSDPAAHILPRPKGPPPPGKPGPDNPQRGGQLPGQ